MSSPTPTPPPPSLTPTIALPAPSPTQSSPSPSHPAPSPTGSPLPLTLTPQPRKFPAPCWSQDETLALISAYQDKWYSLRRRNLRTADWEAVAAAVAAKCQPSDPSLPPKTSAQCRHKMEKLRKRYRTEKQRLLAFPRSRFALPPSSSWVFFDLMDALENGSDLPPVTPARPMLPPPQHQQQVQLIGQKEIYLKKKDDHERSFSINNYNNNGNSSNNLVMMSQGQVGHRPAAPAAARDSKDELGKYFNEILSGKSGGSDMRLKFKKQSRYDDGNYNGGEEYYGRIQGVSNGGDYGSVAAGYKRVFPKEEEEEEEEEGEYEEEEEGEVAGRKRGREAAVGEMVASIRMLGEGMVRMERMKMELMREIERMRMEMEMKRSEMILESHQLMVDAFIQGFKKCNNGKNKKAKLMMDVE